MDTNTKLALLDYQEGSEQVPVGEWALTKVHNNLGAEGKSSILVFVHQETQESCIVFRFNKVNLSNFSEPIDTEESIIDSAKSILSELNQTTQITLLSKGDPSTYWLYCFHIYFQSCGHDVASVSWDAPQAFKRFIKQQIIWFDIRFCRAIGYYACNFWIHKCREQYGVLPRIQSDHRFIRWSQGLSNYTLLTEKMENNHQLYLKGGTEENALAKSKIDFEAKDSFGLVRNRLSDPNIPRLYFLLPRNTFVADTALTDILHHKRNKMIEGVKVFKDYFSQNNDFNFRINNQAKYERALQYTFHEFVNTSTPRMGCIVILYWPPKINSDNEKTYGHLSIGLRFYENNKEDERCQRIHQSSPPFDAYGSYWSTRTTKKWKLVDEYEHDLRKMDQAVPRSFKVLVPNAMPVYLAMEFMKETPEGEYRVCEPCHILDALLYSTFVQGILPIIYLPIALFIPIVLVFLCLARRCDLVCTYGPRFLSWMRVFNLRHRISATYPNALYRIMRTGNANCVDFVSLVLHGTLDTQPDRVMPSIQFMANTVGIVLLFEYLSANKMGFGIPIYFQLVPFEVTQDNSSKYVETSYQALATKFPACFDAKNSSLYGLYSDHTYTSSMLDEEKIVFNSMLYYFVLVTFAGILFDLCNFCRLCIRTPWGMYTMLKHHAKERMMPIRHCLFGCHTSLFYPISFGIMGSYCGDLALSILPMNMPECASITGSITSNHSWSQAIPPFSTFGDSWPNKESYTKRMGFKRAILVTLGLGMLESWVAFFYDYCHRQRSRQVADISVNDLGPRSISSTELTGLLSSQSVQAIESKTKSGDVDSSVNLQYTS